MMIDADRLPVRTVTVCRKVHGGTRPYHIRERVRVVLARDLEEAKSAKPRNRLEQIRRMDVDELAKRLLTLHDGDAGSYCHMKPECMEALEDDRAGEITDGHCLVCIREWLLADDKF